MIDIAIYRELFGGFKATYIDPITKRAVYCVVGVPEDEDEQEVYKNTLRRDIITHVIHDMRDRQRRNTDYFVKYKELSAKQKGLIRAINEAHSLNFPRLYTFVTLPEFSAFVYESIFPYLAMFKPSDKVYDRLLQFIENQCSTELPNPAKHVQNMHTVKS